MCAQTQDSILDGQVHLLKRPDTAEASGVQCQWQALSEGLTDFPAYLPSFPEQF